MLPAIVQLGGVPVVTDEGDIVYQFQVCHSNTACCVVWCGVMRCGVV